MPRKKFRYLRTRRRKRISDYVAGGTNKPIGDTGGYVTDIAVSQYLHMDIGKADTSSLRSEVLNSSFLLRQMQWHHGQLDTNGNLFHFL